MRLLPTFFLCAGFAVPAAGQVPIAEYDAGTAGNPTKAPDPQSLGWKLDDPSGGQVILTDVSPDGATGFNAWSVDDSVTFSGGRAHYSATFSAQDLQEAADTGWELAAHMRLIKTGGLCVVLDFATGPTSNDDRYLLWLEVAANGTDVVASSNLTGASFVCVGAMDGNYHTFALRKPAGAAVVDAEFWYDGAALGSFPRASSNGNAPAGGLNWGSGSSGGVGIAYWNVVRFSKGTDVGPIGTAYCGPSNKNSTGQSATISAWGNTLVSANDLTLDADAMPQNEIGYFLASETQGFVTQPGNSQGNLCLGGSIGRFAKQVASTGSTGTLTLDVDLANIPVWPGMAVAPGETWSFQAWFTDQNPGATSNFTDGVAITFL